jgi:hypothetical protein
MPDLDDLAAALGKKFIERRDVKAIQHPNGAYTPDRTKFTMQDLRDHIEGKRTLGHYILSSNNRCRVFAFDLDVMKDPTTKTPPEPPIVWENDQGQGEEIDPRAVLLDRTHWARPLIVQQLQRLALALAHRAHSMFEIPVAAAYSGGKGVHVYAFPTEPDHSAVVREVALEVLNSFSGRFKNTRGSNFFGVDGYVIDIEVFPKQSDLDGKDLGNLMRLPLGINRKTGERSHFIRLDRDATEFMEMDARSVLIDGALPW